VAEELWRLEESIDWILNTLREGIRAYERTLENLKELLDPLDEPIRSKCLNHLFTLLVKEIRAKSPTDHNEMQKQRTVISVLFRVQFEYGRVETTLCRIIGFIDVDSSDITNNWINFVAQEIPSAVYAYSDALSQRALDVLREHAALFSRRESDLSRAMPAFLPYVTALKRAVESAEFSRFEEQLRAVPPKAAEPAASDGPAPGLEQPTVAAAMREASDYLHSDGIFNPKKAADLMRTSIDESHREIVGKLVKLTGAPCADVGRDGARRAYLRKVGFISEPEERFFSAIYTLLSGEATHKLIAPRETMLVMERTVHDYLMLLNRRLSSFSPTHPEP
jgi:hypothetical protein